MRLHSVLCATVALALVAGACGGDDDDNSSSNSRPPVTDRETTTTSSSATTTSGTSTTPDIGAAKIMLTRVAGGLQLPVAMAVRAGDADALYIAEQHVGRVVRIVDGAVAGDPVLDLGGRVSQGNEQGLLGITFSRDGRLLYVDYTDNAGDSHIQEFAMNGNAVDMATRRDVLTVDQPYPNHNGGEVIFGPDNMLYIGFGDGGSAGDPQGNAQNLNQLLGKILRIDPRQKGNAPYTVPTSNPFVNDENARPEIWMYGLRNPWRFSFDRATGDQWIGDVGQGMWEEIDYARAGAKGTNWGWDRREGAHSFEGSPPANAVDPIAEASHDDGNCAIVGGYVYRGQAISALRGIYLYSDNCNGTIMGVVQRNGKLVQQESLGIEAPNPSSFGEDANGELYVLSLAGEVLRVDAG
jgi:glucose/arabinose dehydrogenase